MSLEWLMDMYSLTDKQLDQEINNSDFVYLAAYFGNFDLYAVEMELSPTQIGDVKNLAFRYSTRIAMANCLRSWRNNMPYQATYRALLSMALKFKEDQVAIDISQYLFEEINGGEYIL